MTDLLALAERVEKLTGPDEYIDCLIREAIEGWKNVGGGWREWPNGSRERYDFRAVPRYTESLDAAMTLVPEGQASQTTQYADGTGHCFIGFDDAVRAATPAIALTAASLRALARQREG